MTREISTFQATKGSKNIIPVMIEDIDPDSVYDGLRSIQAILFHENMLTGFTKLLQVLGVNEFLSVRERRNGEERRVMPVNQRFRFGIWKAHKKSTGTHSDKFEQIHDLSTMSRIQILDAVMEELTRHQVYTREGKKHKLGIGETDKIMSSIWEELCKREYITAVIFIESIDDEITRMYELRPIDRRNSPPDTQAVQQMD